LKFKDKILKIVEGMCIVSFKI